jgi:DNA adenine methylase
MLNAKPFLKWAGGKTQLIPSIEVNLPIEIREEKFTYVEPFSKLILQHELVF